MSCELELVDRWGRIVVLDHSNWQAHLAYRPEMAPYHGELETVLADPDVVVERPNGQWHFYRRGILQGKEANCYLKVVIEEFADGWKLKTTFPSATVRPQGIRRWNR